MSKPTDQIFITQGELEYSITKGKFTKERVEIEVQKIIKSIS